MFTEHIERNDKAVSDMTDVGPVIRCCRCSRYSEDTANGDPPYAVSVLLDIHSIDGSSRPRNRSNCDCEHVLWYESFISQQNT